MSLRGLARKREFCVLSVDRRKSSCRTLLYVVCMNSCGHCVHCVARQLKCIVRGRRISKSSLAGYAYAVE